MIVTIHFLFLLIQQCIKQYKREKFKQQVNELQEDYEKVILEDCIVDIEANLCFDPPVYKQRYGAIQSILLKNDWNNDIKKIVDFGCAECGLFQFIKRLFKIQEILEVDIDEDLLRDNLLRLRPLTIDHISRRTQPLTVQVLAGSISDPDVRLLDVDAVIAIEIIEHLYPDTLDALPYNIFGFIKPKLAIFTTPNADFNVLFPNFNGIRHYDHKFEWSRDQFEAWATNITYRFPNYSVSFEGIGEGPEMTKYLGQCSQMAIFLKNRCNSPENSVHAEGLSLDYCTCKRCQPKSSIGVCTYCSHTEIVLNSFNLSRKPKTQEEAVEGSHYQIIDIINYPYEVDDRTPEEKILDNLKYKMHLMDSIDGRFFNDDKDRVEIPLVELIFDQHTNFTTIEEASTILKNDGYKIEECMLFEELQICVVYQLDMDNNSSPPLSSVSSTTQENPPYSEWTTISDNGELDWGEDEDVPNITSPWLDHIDETSQTEKVEIEVAEDSNSSTRTNDTQTLSHVTGKSVDSGYTNVTTSTPSCSETIDADSLNDEFKKSDHIAEVKCVLDDIITTCCDLEKPKSSIKNFRKNEISPSIPSTIVKPHLEFMLETKVTKNKRSPSKDFNLPETSFSRRRKKIKLCESDDEDNVDVQHHVGVEKGQVNEEDGHENEIVEVMEVVENGDLANNNRDLEGNNYPNAQEQNLGNDNENIIFLQDNEELPIDADVENRNIDEEEDASVDKNQVGVEFASQEALFDPNSEVDLLQDYDFHADAVLPINPGLSYDGFFRPLEPQDIVIRGISMLPQANSDGLANVETFPQWLLQLLNAEENGDNRNGHVEPHFYCQGDGLGVHPSFLDGEPDDESTDSSADSSTTSGISTNDAAEPSVSEIEASSLPYDMVEVGSDQNASSTENFVNLIVVQGSSSGAESPDEFFDTVDELEISPRASEFEISPEASEDNCNKK